MNRKWKLSAGLTVTLAALLLLATLAYAATQSGLLTRLFPHSTPTPQAQRLVTPVGLSQSQDGCTLTIDEYLLDGTTLYLYWTAHSSAMETMLLLPGSITAPHYMLSGWGETDTIGPALGVLLGDEVNGVPLKQSYSATSRIDLSTLATLDAPFDVTLTALFMQPKAPIIKEAGMTDRDASPTLMLMPDSSGSTGFVFLLDQFEWQEDGRRWDISRPDGMGLSMGRGHGAADLQMYGTWPGKPINHLTARDYELQGYAKLAAEIPVTFSVIPDAANITHAGIDAPFKFSFDAFDVEVTKADFTATSMDINFFVDDKHTGKLPVEDLYFQVRLDGQALPYAPGQSIQTNSDWTDSRFGVSIQSETSNATPSSLTIIPCLPPQTGSADPTALDAYAMTIPLKTTP